MFSISSFQKSIASVLLIILLAPISMQAQLKPKVKKAVYFRKTPPLREMKTILPGTRDRSWKDGIIKNYDPFGSRRVADRIPNEIDPSVQQFMGDRNLSDPIENFDGMGNINNVLPPDTDGDVSADYYVQMINLSFAVYDKTGNLLYGPVDNSTLWDGFIGPWTGTNDGDPIILYDEEADRWLASQFAFNTADDTDWELIAISETNDPTGSWFQYAYEFTPYLPDYPKFGIWHDAYYMSINQFEQVGGGFQFRGVGAVAFERDSMLVGNPNAEMIYFDLGVTADPASMLPADCDGTMPPAGTPNYFAYVNDDSQGYPFDQIRIWEFVSDWSDPSSSTFTESLILQTDPFDLTVCDANRGRCIDQPGTSQRLEALQGRLMYRLQYRNFGSYEAMVTNHVVDADGNENAGVRWYEFRDNGGGWMIHQQGTYAPDTDHRWMASIAMDALGNIGLGYSVSSANTFPSIRYTGRLVGDPLGQMTFAEKVIVAGGGSQQGPANRWGDYSKMSIDPVDGTTFWYTAEYIQTNTFIDWNTRIASFSLSTNEVAALAGIDDSVCLGFAYQLSGLALNADSALWTSSGDGFFNDSTLLDATYTPGPVDNSNGFVELILTAFPIAPAIETDQDTMLLSIVAEPVSLAGTDDEICETQNYLLLGSALNFSHTLWTSSGDGSFDDPTLLDALYTPGIIDLENGFVDLFLTAYPISPCNDSVADTLQLDIQALTEPNAGPDDEICAGQTYTLNGNVENESSFVWISLGDGSFDDPQILNPVYTPGAADISNQFVELVLSADGIPPCIGIVDDTLILDIIPLPTVVLENDPIVSCFDEDVQLQAIAFSYETITWTSSGDGFFSDDQVLDPVYTPGSQDLIDQEIEITATVIGLGPCVNESTFDTRMILIQPNVISDAGEDDVLCINISESYQLNAVANDYESVAWSSSGDGNFSDAAILSPIYTPGTVDINTGSVTLSLEANPILPCTSSFTDQMILEIDICPSVSELNNQSPGLYIHPNPASGFVKYRVILSNINNLVVSLVDLQGTEIYSESFDHPSHMIEGQINLQSLPEGVYIVTAKAGTDLYRTKLVVR